MRLAIFCDFDGTITQRDSLDALVDAFIGPERRGDYDRLVFDGAMPLWQVLDTSLSACEVSLAEAIAFLQSHVHLDPGFGGFHAWCAQTGLPVEIVSAGIFEIVEAFMTSAGLSVPITANRADCRPNGFGLTPLSTDCPTGVDKGAIVREAKARGEHTVFVGDGISDRAAVVEADWVYAKAGLARFCQARGIPFVPYETFFDVQADLSARLAGKISP